LSHTHKNNKTGNYNYLEIQKIENLFGNSQNWSGNNKTKTYLKIHSYLVGLMATPFPWVVRLMTTTIVVVD